MDLRRYPGYLLTGHPLHTPELSQTHAGVTPSGGVRMNKKDPAGPGEEQLHELPFSQNPKERMGPAAGRGLGEARWCEGHVGQEHPTGSGIIPE